jgi:adenine-specific DNA glycosylase
MEFGALICKPKNPICDRCPIASNCCTFREKLDCSRIPKFQKIVYVKKTIQRIFICDGQFIILKKTNGKRLHNIFELPLLDDTDKKIPLQEIAKIRRSIAHEHIEEIIFEPQYLDLKILTKNYPNLISLPIHELKNITLSSPHRKWLNGQLCL